MKKTFIYLFLSLISLCACVQSKSSNSVDLIADKSLSNWDYAFKEEVKNPQDIFFVKDNILNVTGEVFGYAYTKEKYDNFKLHIEWSFPQGSANSGLFLYMTGEAKVWPSCVECQLMSGKAGNFFFMGEPKEEFKAKNGTTRMRLKQSLAKNPSNEVALGQWNKADVICENGNIKVYINGLLQNEATSKEKLGHIALQSEGGYILFRNIILEKL